MTVNHWIYAITILAVIIGLVKRRDVVLICLIGTFLIGISYTESIIGGFQTIFNALLTSGEELFDIMLVIALMVSMLKSLETMGADRIMVAPARKLMRNPTTAFFTVGIVMYLASLFFWPTPATALVGTILAPVAIEAGLPAIYTAMAISIFGHGMALSGDMILQGAPKLVSDAANVDVVPVLSRGALLSVVAGVVSIAITYIMMVKEDFSSDISSDINIAKVKKNKNTLKDKEETSLARTFAVIVPMVLIITIIVMVKNRIVGGSATALLGGIGTIILIISSITQHKNKCLEQIVDYLKHGFKFAINIFSPVIPIAGFFFLGGKESVGILGEGAPPLLFDLGNKVASFIPINKLALGFGNLLIGIITGLDGSGFSGLPMVGGIAQALGGPLNVDVATLGAIGQIGAVWSGGGTLVAWAFGLAATAGVTGVPPLELARKNFIPVICGLIIATIAGTILM